MVKFHMLSGDYCPYCKMAKGAIMLYMGARNESELRSHLKVYDVEDGGGNKFRTNFEDVVPPSWKTIPAIVEEDRYGKYHFVGGLYDFVDQYSSRR